MIFVEPFDVIRDISHIPFLTHALVCGTFDLGIHSIVFSLAVVLLHVILKARWSLVE